jgi:chromosome segregation ATPase
LPKVQEHIAHIDAQLQQLLQNYERLKIDQQKKDETINNLQQKLGACQEKLEQMQQENLILKASMTKMDPEDKKIFDQKIQLYIKNIDTCISLLSQ